jgi:hypothetical protein
MNEDKPLFNQDGCHAKDNDDQDEVAQAEGTHFSVPASMIGTTCRRHFQYEVDGQHWSLPVRS